MKLPQRLIFVLPLIMSLVSGCSTLYLNEQESAEIRQFLDSVEKAEEVSIKAREYREQGEIIKALGLLQTSTKEFPENENINQLILEYERSWKRQQLVLENQLLLVEARRLIEALPILEELSKGHPNSHFFKTRILLWEAYLNNKEPELIDCGIELEKENIWLAKRCLAMAYRISPKTETKQRLVASLDQIEKIQQVESEKVEQREGRERADRVEQLLSEAVQERRQGALLTAKEKIDEALKQDPESLQVREQMSELQVDLGRQVEVLMKLGDKLYRNQHTRAAIAVWEAALKLDPNQQQVSERIVRATTVLNKLESIRSSGTEPSSP